MPPGKSNTTTGTGPPKTHSPTPTNAPNTRCTTRNPSTTDDILALPNDVMDTTDAEKFLASKLLCLEDQPFTAAHLSSILFHITQMSSATPSPVIAAIRAVAFLLRKQVVCEIAEAAANTLASSLTESISSRLVDHTIAALAPQIASIHVASEALSKTAQQADTTLTTTLDKAERVHRLAANERTEQEGGVSVAAELGISRGMGNPWGSWVWVPRGKGMGWSLRTRGPMDPSQYPWTTVRSLAGLQLYSTTSIKQALDSRVYFLLYSHSQKHVIKKDNKAHREGIRHGSGRQPSQTESH
jgi:hypothetical protein